MVRECCLPGPLNIWINRLAGGVRRDVFAVIEDLSIDGKVQRAAQAFSLNVQSPTETMRRFLALDLEQDPDTLGLVVATVYGVSVDGLEELLPDIESLATSGTHPLVRETANWVVARIKRGPAQRGRRLVVPLASDEGDSPTGRSK